MKIRSFLSDSIASDAYLISDRHGNAVIIDPSVDPANVPELSEMRLNAILLTHAHFDHFLFLDRWKTLTNAPIYVHPADAAALTDPLLHLGTRFGCELPFEIPPDRMIEELDVLSFGEMRFAVYPTPGHTPGSVCYHLETALFCGDLLFAGGGVGRSDFPGGCSEDLHISVKKMLSLPDETILYPGHGLSTTVIQERKFHA